MKQIWKYDIEMEGVCELSLPVGSEVLCAQEQYGGPKLWALVDPNEKKMETRRFRHSGTGHDIPEENLEYIDTYQLINGSLIFHLFEIKEEIKNEL